MGGDKIVLLDGAGANGGGAATNGLLSMIPGMFANLIGGNKMDPNLVAALMNGRNNQDGFGGANGWWLWIIVLFWLWGGRGFGNGFGNGGDCCANGLPAQLNNDYGRELLMQAIQGNRSAIDQIASALNCSTTQLQNAICNVQGAIDKVAGQVGMTSQAVINAVQQQGCEIGNQISSCCCNLSSLINQSTCQTQGMITQQGFDNQLRTAGNRIPVAGLFHITFFLDMNIAHESKSNKTPLYLIGELIGVPNTVMDSALHELKDRIDKDPKYKDVKNWLESLPKI